jgi:glutamate dehydrogenase (NAD(P)+)
MHAGHAVTEIVTGKPVSAGGTVGRREATGRGVAYLVSRALEKLELRSNQCSAIVQGFGNVGSYAAITLARQYGLKIVGLSDHTAAYYDKAGLPLDDILKHVEAKHVLAGWSKQGLVDAGELLTRECDVLVPAAVERVIDGKNAGSLKCRVLAEGANGPTTPDADAVLAQRNDEIFVIPDILCNSGGVIVSYFEWVQDLQQLFWTEVEVNSRLERLIEMAFAQVVKRAAADRVANRTAAMSIGVEKVWAGKRLRGLFP